jgi:cytochrome P450
VLNDENIHQTLKQELKDSVPQWPGEVGEMPDISVLQQLPFLNAVISESLRIFPSIPGAMPRKIVADNLKIGDITLKKDVSQRSRHSIWCLLIHAIWLMSGPSQTVVSVQNWSLHKHEEYFPEPHRFKPERFLGPGGKTARDGLNAFSEGPRGCIGRK